MKVRFVTNTKFEVGIDVREDAESEEIYKAVLESLIDAEVVDIDEDIDIEWRTIDCYN